MSNSTDQILEQLGNLGSAGVAAPASAATPPKPAGGLPAADLKDNWRILLVDLIYNLNSSFRDAFYWKGVKTDKDPYKDIARTLYKLNEVPNDDGTVHISLRGAHGSRISEKADYVVRLGDLTVDANAISAVVKRLGIRLKHLEGRLIKSFEQFALQGIETFNIRIPDDSAENLEAIRISLRIVSCFNQAVENDAPIKFIKNNESRTVPLILNEFAQPDPNLTQLAALNGLSSENMRQIVEKVSALMKGPAFSRNGRHPVNVYQTIFHVKSLKDKMLRPPIEINSEKTLAADTGRGAVSGGGNNIPADTTTADLASRSGQNLDGMGEGQEQNPAEATPEGAGADIASPELSYDINSGMPLPESAAEIRPELMKAKIAGLVKKSYGSSTVSALQAMRTIYGQDYGELDIPGLENRLQQIAELLQVVESTGGEKPVVEEMHQRVQAGLSRVPREYLDDLVIQDDQIKIWDGDEEKVLGKADDTLADIIETSKKKSAARRKIKLVLGPEKQILDLDCEQLAQAFDLAPEESEEIVKHFKDCFDNQGNFQRALFEKKVADFARYPKHIFEILWEILRETPRRRDRLPFLNSMQLLISEIGQPKQAIKILLSDLLLMPDEISHSDRNALMLIIMFLRTYNKEINMDIEITPEEVLLVQVGLNQSVAQYTAWKINAELKKVVEKMTTIRKRLLVSLEMEGSDDQVTPVRLLMALEREAHIFMSLVGGDTAAAILRSALKVYGNPASQVYMLKESEQYFSVLLQHLAVLIRGLIRVGQPADIESLKSVKSRQDAFMGLSEAPRHSAQVRRTLAWVDTAVREIETRTKGE
jgi:hypothetical protein